MLVTLGYTLFINFQQQDDFKLQSYLLLLKFLCFIRVSLVYTVRILGAILTKSQPFAICSVPFRGEVIRFFDELTLRQIIWQQVKRGLRRRSF